MAENTHIEWTDATWNPITGCSVVSPGCTNCYAMKLAGTRLQHHPSRAGLTKDTKAGPVWTGEVRLNEAWLDQPLRWRRPRAIFVCAHGDLFHESVPFAWIDRVWATMALASQHTFQVLTKRADRMLEYLTDNSQARADGRGKALVDLGYRGPMEAFSWPLPNVWLGVSVEDKIRAEERVPKLLMTPAAIRWVSYEPALEYVDFRSICTGHYFIDALAGHKYHDAPEDEPSATEPCARVDWLVMGGESGDRPMHPFWPKWIARDCAEAGTPFLFKQWGSWREAAPGDTFDTSKGRAGKPPAFIVDPLDGSVHCFLPKTPSPDLRVMVQVGKKAAGRHLDGVLHDARPEVR